MSLVTFPQSELKIPASDLADAIEDADLWEELTFIPDYSGYNYVLYGSGLGVRMGGQASSLRFILAIREYFGFDMADELTHVARFETLAGDLVMWFPGVTLDGELPS